MGSGNTKELSVSGRSQEEPALKSCSGDDDVNGDDSAERMDQGASNESAKVVAQTSKASPMSPPSSCSSSPSSSSSSSSGSSSSSSNTSGAAASPTSPGKRLSPEDLMIPVQDLQQEELCVANEMAPVTAERALLRSRFLECLEVLQVCDQWSEQERQAFLQRIKDEKLDFLVDAHDEMGNTLLILAAMGQQLEVVDVLLRHGADPNHQNSAGFSALHYCCCSPQSEDKHARSVKIAKLLLKFGGSCNLIEATAGCGPLHYAASENSWTVCNLLLKKGANVSLRCKNGFLPEAYARASGHNELADYLHEKLKTLVSDEVKAKIARQENKGGHGWRKHFDTATGRYFYFNHRTLKSTWDRPVEMDLFEDNSFSFANMDEVVSPSSPPPDDADEDEDENENNRDRGKRRRSNRSKGSKMSPKTSQSHCRDVRKVDSDSDGEGAASRRGKSKDDTDIDAKALEQQERLQKELEAEQAERQRKHDAEKAQLRAQLEMMQARLEEAQAQAQREAEQVTQLRRVAQEADAKFAAELRTLQTDLEHKKANHEETQKQVERLKAHYEASKKNDIDMLKRQFEKEREEELDKLERQREEERRRHESELEKRMEQLQTLEAQLAKELKEKKEYFNEIEDLKGAIRVCARVRPLSRSEEERGCHNVLEVFGNSIKIKHTKTDKFGTKTDHKIWSFDKCLGPLKAQEDVFEDTKRLVQSAIDGFNVCIFAYGQTGAGKTYTMAGLPEDPGIYPRAVDTLFECMDAQSNMFDFSLELYMCELHLDTLVDLLTDKEPRRSSLGKASPMSPHTAGMASPKSPQSGMSAATGVALGADMTTMAIKKDQFGVVYVENITVIPVATKDDLLHHVRRGEAKRSTDSTKMNDTSSRSHLVISIVVKSESKHSGEITSGKITLVDLAGSERVAKSGAEGQTFKEATSINKALSALGEVINALTTGSKHVPYRNNPLTQLMSDSIGGNAKTLMIVNVSPADYNANETIASLNFASRCKSVRNSASKGFETRELAMLRKEIAKLRGQRNGS